VVSGCGLLGLGHPEQQDSAQHDHGEHRDKWHEAHETCYAGCYDARVRACVCTGEGEGGEDLEGENHEKEAGDDGDSDTTNVDGCHAGSASLREAPEFRVDHFLVDEGFHESDLHGQRSGEARVISPTHNPQTSIYTHACLCVWSMSMTTGNADQLSTPDVEVLRELPPVRARTRLFLSPASKVYGLVFKDRLLHVRRLLVQKHAPVVTDTKAKKDYMIHGAPVTATKDGRVYFVLSDSAGITVDPELFLRSLKGVPEMVRTKDGKDRVLGVPSASEYWLANRHFWHQAVSQREFSSTEKIAWAGIGAAVILAAMIVLALSVQGIRIYAGG